MAARGDLGKFGKDLVIEAPVAAGYVMLANWAMRKAGLSYGTRAAVSVVGGGVAGYLLVKAGADGIGKTVAVAGAAASIVYGVAEVGTRMFLGSPDSRQALPTGTAATGTAAGMPALGAGQPRQVIPQNTVPMVRVGR